MKNWIFLLLMAAAVLGTNGCSKEYKAMSHAVRKGSIVEKDSAAFYFYNRGDYEKASLLFDELVRVYRGQERAKDILYYYAYSRYNAKDYITATYHFEQFARLYLTDPRAEECQYMDAYCFYLQSAPSYLDQSSTNKAIQQFQFFANSYPYSRRTQDAANYITELRERLAKKEFDTAKLYYDLGNYRSAVSAYHTFIQEYPDSRYREESQFMLFQSAFMLADVSVAYKKKNRYLDALDYYQLFVEKFPTSALMKQATDINDKAHKAVEKIQQGENPES